MSKTVEEINDLLRNSLSQHTSVDELEWGNQGDPNSFRIQLFTQRVTEINIDLYSQADYVEVVNAIAHSIFCEVSL